MIESIVEDFNLDTGNQKKNIKFIFVNEKKVKKAIIFGIESRIEQVVANLLDKRAKSKDSRGQRSVALS